MAGAQVAEREAVGLIAKAAKGALRRSAPVFRDAAEKLGLKGAPKDLLKASEERAVASLGHEGREAAQAVARRAAAAEKVITPKLTGIVDRIPGAKLEGLAFRLKSEDSLLRKVAGDILQDGKTIKGATEGINDAVRYTISASRDEYVQVTKDAIARLKEAGFEPVTVKNFWNGEGYQGINSVWRDASGQTFELQFHSAESLAAKEQTHLIYEMQRVLPEGSDAARRLQQLQDGVFGHVGRPPGAGEIDAGAG